jgi:hypothetical protein
MSDILFEQKTRKLKNGKFVNELDEPVTLTLYTRCPEKYILTDMETGQQYTGRTTKGKSSWKKVTHD